jgi:predicted nucleotidyltransferase component of viral defense system
MVELPIFKKLKKISHKNVAVFEDIIVQEVFNIFSTAVLHGGTAIWRCYKGNRFSEDLDFYIAPKERNKISILLKKLEEYGFKILKRKFTQNAFYSKMEKSNIEIRFEVLFKEVKNYTTKEYESVSGIKFAINTLDAEDLIKEKVESYKKRRLIRDIHDIYFLLDYASRDKVHKSLITLLKDFKEPLDEKKLKFLIISGVAPKLEEILNKIKKYANY